MASTRVSPVARVWTQSKEKVAAERRQSRAQLRLRLAPVWSVTRGPGGVTTGLAEHPEQRTQWDSNLAEIGLNGSVRTNLSQSNINVVSTDRQRIQKKTKKGKVANSSPDKVGKKVHKISFCTHGILLCNSYMVKVCYRCN